MRQTLLAQTRVNPWLMGALYAPVLITLVVAALVCAWTDIPSGDLTRDPAAILNVSPFLGTLSNLGILLWCACGTICLFSATLLRREIHNNALPIFLLAGGLLTFLLLLDDLFMVHEYVLPTYLEVPETVVYAGYVLLLLFFLVWFRNAILGTQFYLLLFAFGFFGLSIAMDLLPADTLPGRFLIEDGFKLFGIASWFGYFVCVCFRSIESSLLADRVELAGQPYGISQLDIGTPGEGQREGTGRSSWLRSP